MAPGPELETAAQTQTTLTFIIFTLPLVLLSLIGGTLADRLSKRTVIIAIKVVEVLLMSAGTVALWLNPSGGILPLIVLCGMGVHSALFAPSKYGILPELIPHERLAAGNGLLEVWTFAAILTGTAAGGFLLQAAGDQRWIAPLILAALSVVGLIAAFAVPHVSPARTTGGVGSTIRIAWAAIQTERLLRLAIPGQVFFWTIASLFAQNVLVYAKAVLHLSDAMSGLPLTLLSVGIGLGAMVVGRLSQNRIEYGLIPLGAVGAAIALSLLGALTPPLFGTFLVLGLLGVSCSFIFVPLNAILQWRSPPDRRGAVISFSNTCVFTGILLGSLAGGSLANAGLSTSSIFLVTAGVTIVGTAWALWLMPDVFLRLLLVTVHEHALSPPHRRSAAYSPIRRGVARPESYVVCRWVLAHGQHRSAYTVRGGCRLCDPPALQMVDDRHEGHPDCFDRRPSHHPPGATQRGAGPRRRRDRLHLP